MAVNCGTLEAQALDDLNHVMLYATTMLWAIVWIVLTLLFVLPKDVIEWSRRTRHWLGKQIQRLVPQKEWENIKDDFEDF